MFKVVLYIVASFFCYTVSLISFFKTPSTGVKLAIMGVFTIPGLIAFVAGAALDQFRHWKKHAGIVLLCGSAFALFVVLSFLTIHNDPEFLKMAKTDHLDIFSDYLSGAALMVLLTLTGITLIRTHTSSQKETKSDPPPLPTTPESNK